MPELSIGKPSQEMKTKSFEEYYIGASAIIETLSLIEDSGLVPDLAVLKGLFDTVDDNLWGMLLIYQEITDSN